MIRSSRRACVAALLLLIAATAQAQSNTRERDNSVFSRLSGFINRVGERTEELLAPAIGSFGGWAEEDWSGLETFVLTIDVKSNTLRPDAVVDFASDLAEAHVRIQAWENPIVQLTADITAGADSPDAAAELARAVEVDVTETPSGDRVIVRPKYPDTRDAGRVMLTARFTIRVPATEAPLLHGEAPLRTSGLAARVEGHHLPAVLHPRRQGEG